MMERRNIARNYWKFIADKLIYIVPVFCLMSTWFGLEMSEGWSSKTNILRMDIRYIMLNVLTLAVVYAVLVIVLNRHAVAGIVFNTIFFIIAVVNYYTVEFHGSPLTVQELGNFKAAANVLENYSITIDKYVLLIIFIFVFNLALNIILLKTEKKLSGKKIIIRDFIYVIAGVTIMYFGYFSSNPVKPKDVITWSWLGAAHEYGYVACSVESITNMFHIYDEPGGYSDEAVEAISITVDESLSQTPDILLILNETFYDLSVITDIPTDVSYLENISTLDNAIRGYAVVPSSEGGTNNSEYELLTSNSYSLFNNVTPFTVLDMEKADTVVSHLKELGYTTIGAHASDAENYNRHIVYPDMGFDQIYFKEDFAEIEHYGQRELVTDACMYQNLYQWYEATPKDSPIFSYLLTIQNHGGWDMNNSEEDTVHVQKDFGELTEPINEFLSCIRLSDEAFAGVVEYYEQVDRPTIICMVGDHSPSFIGDIPNDSFTKEEREVLERSVPFIIWANFDIEEKDMGTISLNYLVPMLLEIAQVKPSAYYAYMQELREQVPVFTSCGYYIGDDGQTYAYGDESGYIEEVNNYFYLEYNRLQGSK